MMLLGGECNREGELELSLPLPNGGSHILGSSRSAPKDMSPADVYHRLYGTCNVVLARISLSDGKQGCDMCVAC